MLRAFPGLKIETWGTQILLVFKCDAVFLTCDARVSGR